MRVIRTPDDYFKTLKRQVWFSRKRIVLASLYLGTGRLEKGLVSCLHGALNNWDIEGLRMRILLDYCRGTKGGAENSSCTMLNGLLKRAHPAEVYLYHTPLLRGFWKLAMPARWNEVFGVQHMKVAVFDDAVLISGANLSESYFTDRQDRYVLVEKAPGLADFYEELIDAVCRHSFRLVSAEKGSQLEIGDGHLKAHPYRDSLASFAAELGADIEQTLAKWRELASDKRPTRLKADDDNSQVDTAIYPLVQVAPLGVYSTDHVIRRTFAEDQWACDDEHVTLASGYFNLTDDYELLLLSSAYRLDIVSASPRANAFFAARGLSGYVPALYSQAAKRFFGALLSAGQSDRVTLWEYNRKRWTFHAKGLWCTLADSDLPAVTFVGSSNFGYRSSERDLETQLVIVTQNGPLQKQLAEERKALLDYSERVDWKTFADSDHYVPILVRWAYRWIRSFF